MSDEKLKDFVKRIEAILDSARSDDELAAIHSALGVIMNRIEYILNRNEPDYTEEKR